MFGASLHAGEESIVGDILRRDFHAIPNLDRVATLLNNSNYHVFIIEISFECCRCCGVVDAASLGVIKGGSSQLHGLTPVLERADSWRLLFDGLQEIVTQDHKLGFVLCGVWFDDVQVKL